ncbi:ROK family protein [Yersinia alsatica]|uniref:ROK family protein n=1 Tax=Yersinia alsatica TaxID=2890317 RepID=A0ABY5UP95_9GAMM|nr:ROK family protein [Yersinia alsatica]OWF67657.1 beta-glucoside kinase [Yersinia frederiksenii]UWM45293.1 ROK family protein [Yersinia alsatica]CNL25418.1 N-acetyl-D-glucosamine kinase [Yersinia frederiksenii]CNL59033.1 N-acetyl-D-glucosamine kinase [Yersinia frederiksenii]
MKIAAFDIGGTSLKMGIVSSEGKILAQGKAAIQESNGDQILHEIQRWLDLQHGYEGIAISAPGHVNPFSGLISMGGAIRRFDDFNLKIWLEQRCGLPVSIENDANCVLLAEKWLGKARQLDDFLCLTIGTGIGGGIFANGNLVRGGHYRAGEFGYMFSSQPGAERPGSYTMNEVSTLLVLRRRFATKVNRPIESVTGEEIFTGYDNGDLICRRLVDTFYNDICAGIYNLVHLFDPTHIFIGGGITERETFLDELNAQLNWFDIKDTVIDIATYKNHSGLLGAVYHFHQIHQAQ